MSGPGFLLRGLVGAALLMALVWRVGGQDLARVLRDPSWPFVWVSLGFSFLLVGASCLKWQALLRHVGVAVGLGRLFALYLIGILFNQFLPSNVGGDVVRSVGLGRLTRGMPHAFVSVFLERLTGLVALVACAWLGAVARPDLLSSPVLDAALFATSGGLAVLLWASVDPRALHWAGRLLPGSFAERLGRRLEPFREALHAFRDSRLMSRAMGLSLLFYAFAVGNVWVTARIFGATPDVAGLAVAVPMVLVVSLVPISVGGVGITEWAYVVCLGAVGMGEGEALAIGLFLRVKQLLLAAIGGALFVWMRFEPTAERAES